MSGVFLSSSWCVGTAYLAYMEEVGHCTCISYDKPRLRHAGRRRPTAHAHQLVASPLLGIYAAITSAGFYLYPYMMAPPHLVLKNEGVQAPTHKHCLSIS